MNCCDDYGNCRQGRDCPARVNTGHQCSTASVDVLYGLSIFLIVFTTAVVLWRFF